jgi:predicted nucleic-acid-binding Zn-ribbon protein
MKLTQKCPKCVGQKFAVTDEFRVPDQDSSNMTEPFPAVTINTHRDTQERSPWDRKTMGTFETWICLGCGFTELYAKSLGGVEALAAQHPERLRIVDATPKDGPYR